MNWAGTKLKTAGSYSGVTNDVDDYVRKPPVIGFCAFSGTGKTTLLKKIIPILRARNLRLAVIKHAHHEFDIDHLGKDARGLRQAGAEQIVVSSKKRKAIIIEHSADQSEAKLTALIEDLDHTRLDLILIEGFKAETYSKIELHRATMDRPFMYKNDPNIVAIATDHTHSAHLPVLDINQPTQIAEFILEFTGLDMVNCLPAPLKYFNKA